MIRGASDLTTLMTPGSEPEEVIARRGVLHLLLNDSFGIHSYFVNKMNPSTRDGSRSEFNLSQRIRIL